MASVLSSNSQQESKEVHFPKSTPLMAQFHALILPFLLWCVGIDVNFICTLSQFWRSATEKRTNCSRQLLQLPPAPQPTYIHPCHHSHLAPIRACEWQPHSPAAPDSVVAVSVPREPTAGGRSIEEALIITNHLPGREPWHIFITVVIKAISDYHQDIKLTRHLE